MTTRARRHGRRIAIVLAIVAGVVLVLLVVAFLFRDALASYGAARALKSAGLVCEPVEVHVPAALIPSIVELAPMRCTSASGPLSSLRFDAPVHVELDGTHVELVRCSSMQVDLRPQRRDVELNTLGDLSSVVGLDQPGVDLLLDLASLGPREIPPLAAERAVVRIGGARVAELRDMRLWPQRGGESISVAEARLEQASLLGPAAVSGHATPARGSVALQFGGPIRVELTGTRLSSDRPIVEFSVSLRGPPRRPRRTPAH